MINIILAGVFSLTACKKDGSHSTPPVYAGDTTVALTTDKAVYKPGDAVLFTMDKALPATARVRYRQLSRVIAETGVTGKSWQWTAPSADFTGYMVDVYNAAGGTEKIYGSIAVDISSDWGRFPRYGHLSAFGALTGTYMDSVVSNLTRLHINGLQFYDWSYEHHQPLAGTVSSPAASWKDIASRDCYRTTVDHYISAAHARGMMAMSYNLCYGALNDAAADGVSDQWYMYTDQQHQVWAGYRLSAPFKSNIWLTNPGNPAWQQYIAGRTKDMYDVYAFDGYHVDQVGDLGTMYDYNGNVIDVATGFGSFLAAMKSYAPSKRLVMNAVNQFGQQGNIAKAPVDFLYTEVWAPNEGFSDLARIITDDYSWSGNTKKPVLTAYMNWNLANNPGYFNTPGVLLADAVIFAFGGAHLEMGDHMLCKEYFPNDNLKMKPDLQQAIVRYYDFLTGYENLLRDGGAFNNPGLVSVDGKISLNNWPPQNGSISMIGKDMGSRQVIHLINFSSAASFDWRDTNGSQTVPATYSNLSFILTTTKPVSKLWMASPDVDGGVLKEISFTRNGNAISFILPSLTYWDMIVAEY
ncbi:MAG: cycloisomaltooligosaccharide glucanotransferase [Sphingobacteriales bacterium 50-39]|nr:glycoside hydrolase family 66 protein [Sphingobacteriales bacterium]OJW56040.1 MAG: cycloisomaltooligosaccharide glucanotransferase [Sphingobacteriales bacterium 50-39]